MNTEVCIVGGGLVGLSAAIAFARQGRAVTLLEASDLKPDVPAELDARSIALSYSTVQIFKALEVWPQLHKNAAPISNIHVSSAGHFGVTRLTAEDCRLDAMGYVIEYHLLIQVLLNAAENEKNIQVITPARVETVEQADEAVKLQYLSANKASTLNTLLLIVADGANSSVREKLGISVKTRDYQQTAIISNIKINRPSNDCAFERFTQNGPLALLPLPKQRYAMVWTNTPSRAEALMQLSDEKFIQQLYKQFGYRLGLLDSVGSRVRFDLKLTQANKLVAGRAVLIGNAANALHPVAGQGFNLALRDIGVLIDLLSDVNLQTDVVQSQLDVYQLQRADDQHQTVNYGDRLVQLFSNNIPLLNHFRAGALGALDLCPVMKKEVSWQGMGYGPGCSSLMRGVR